MGRPPLDDVQDKWKNMQGQRAGRETRGAADPLDEARKRSRNSVGRGRDREGATGKLLFAGLFDTLNAQRSSVMAGSNR